MRRLTPWLIGVGVVTFLAGLLFGYDQGVISGALPLIQDDLGLSTIESEIITSWVTLGALLATFVAVAWVLFALMCAVTFVFVWRLVAETKGRSLEEIQADWKAAA